MKLNLLLYASILFVNSFVLAEGARRSLCEIPNSSQFDSWLKQYVPRSVMGEASAGFYAVNSNGNVDKIVFEKNAHRPQPIASAQKIFTAYTAFQKSTFRKQGIYSKADRDLDRESAGLVAQFADGSAMREGETVLVGQLVRSLLAQSSNGAANAIARATSESNIGNFMNLLNRLGLETLGSSSYRSYFRNPSGLTPDQWGQDFLKEGPEQRSTAHNLALMWAHMNANKLFERELRAFQYPFGDRYITQKVGITIAAGVTIVVKLPLPKSCRSENLVFALFGAPIGGSNRKQLEKFAKLIGVIQSELGFNSLDALNSGEPLLKQILAQAPQE